MNILEKPTSLGTVLVAKIGGSVLAQESLLNDFIDDVQTLVKDGVSIAIVHGSGPAIDLRLAAINKTPAKVQGLRITDADTLAIVIEELSAINNLLVQKITMPGLPAVGFTPAANLLFHAKKMLLQGAADETPDLGFVGEVLSSNQDKLIACFQQGAIPVIAPLGADKQGTVYNINADHAALAIASCFGTSKLISITDVPGLLADPSVPTSLIKHLSLAEAENMLASKAVSGGMLPKLESCIKCLKSGVKTVHIIDGHIKHGLLKAVREPLQIGSLISSE